MVYFINPRSGKGLGRKLLDIRGAGRMVSIDPPNIQNQLRQYAGTADRIVVAGGDGTFSLVIGAIFRLGWQDRISLYLFPIGTGNDLARSLQAPRMSKLPKADKDWAELCPQSVALPIWRYGDYYFVNYLSWGMDAKMLAEVEGFRAMFPANLTLRKLSFTLASVRHIRYLVQSPSRMLIDGREYELEGKAGVIISNLPYYLGGSRISTLAPEDPYLSVTFINKFHELFRLGLTRNLGNETPVIPFVKSDSIQLIGPGLPMQIDGEVGIYQETAIEYAGRIRIWTPE